MKAVFPTSTPTQILVMWSKKQAVISSTVSSLVFCNVGRVGKGVGRKGKRFKVDSLIKPVIHSCSRTDSQEYQARGKSQCVLRLL